MTLEDECGGRSQIVIDDRCYVLYNRRFGTERYAMVCHWYREAAEALSLHLRTKDHFILGLVETAKIKRNMA